MPELETTDPKTQTSLGSPDRPYIGGQAVLEGVMMRSPSSFAVAVRRADGSISIKERPIEKKVNRWATFQHSGIRSLEFT